MSDLNMEQNLQELYNWIDLHEISRPKKNLNRDFSDAVPLAEILKVHFPKYVELHNYAARNSYLKKLDNWNTLNRKVLAKLNLKLATNDIENAAKAAPGAIENILFQIKKKVESANSEKVASDPGTANVEESMEGNDALKKKTKMVPAEILEKQSLELDIKNEAIEMLGQKVTHLQNLIQLKDQRIEELNKKLDECMTKEAQNSNSFFKIFSSSTN